MGPRKKRLGFSEILIDAFVNRSQQSLEESDYHDEQGTALNMVDMGLLITCSPRTIYRYVKERENEKNIQIPNRGKVHDLGRGVTHKKEIVRMILQNTQ